jgi:ABC-type glutathione transport system ATPase component
VPTPLVVVEHVKKSFLHEGHEVQILKGIDLRIDHGEMLCIVGPSGAGKSTSRVTTSPATPARAWPSSATDASASSSSFITSCPNSRR